MRRRVFTIEQANRALPRVRRVVENIMRAYREWHELLVATEVEAANRVGGPDVRPETHDEAELRRLAEQIAVYIAQLEALGVSFRGFEEGLVDFPSHIGGRLAYLCWRLGEPAVEHWHEADAGFDGRMRIAPRAIA
ncbi:MAG TPA: DUF2203 domain-containing protein [Gemmatimonadaceae bacterium]|nr:DUF2203 domain-containing protein [Gemmatimonadaceae bacterium]